METTAPKANLFNILFVSDRTSRLYPFRGEAMVRSFCDAYKNLASADVVSCSSKAFLAMETAELSRYTILWIDNVQDYMALRKLGDFANTLNAEIRPTFREDLDKLATDTEKLESIRSMNAQRSDERTRIIYAVDEFYWEAPVGRVRTIRDVQLVEGAMNVADCIVVPTPELKECLTHFGLVADVQKEIVSIPSIVSTELMPLFRDFRKTHTPATGSNQEKTKILVKGLMIPANVQKFIIENYRKYQFSVCSVGGLDPSIIDLIKDAKISHLHHWANPGVNASNIMSTVGIERDGGFDFVIHTKPENLMGNMYDVTAGDEDIMLSIASGAIPISGIADLEYDPASGHLGLASGLVFGRETTAHGINDMVKAYALHTRYNELLGKCRDAILNRIGNAPAFTARMFRIMMGDRKMAVFTAAREAAEAKIAESETTTPTDEDKLIQGNFGGK
jgi:hypothetical protein